MSRLSIPVVALAAAVAAVAACGTEVGIPFHPSVPIRPPNSQPAVPFYGDGADGSVYASDPTVLTRCHAVDAEGMVGFVEADDGLKVGDPVLLVQMQDTAGNAGRFETTRLLNDASAPGGFQLIFGNTLTRHYASSGAARAQVCTIPQFDVLHVATDGQVVSEFWNGREGGIVAVAARRVILDDRSSIAAVSAGFRGGFCTGSNASPVQIPDDEPIPTSLGGGKGEGIDPRSILSSGRSAIANAGGGGNAVAAGGGGGGNGGEGGIGGFGSDSSLVTGDPKVASGRPGFSIDTAGLPRLLLGGGGGSGQRGFFGDPESPCDGGFGGGIVFVLASSLTGSGNLDARGANGSTGFDIGSGAGGAGGTILLRTRTTSWTGILDVRGGSGGDVFWVTTAGHFGGGGGGGGGRIYVDDPALAIDAAGGNPGENILFKPILGGDPQWGATGGASGFAAPTTF